MERKDLFFLKSDHYAIVGKVVKIERPIYSFKTNEADESIFYLCGNGLTSDDFKDLK